jgi:hypothetical protein
VSFQDHKLKIGEGGALQTLAELGVNQCTVRAANLTGLVMSMTVAGELATGTPLLEYGDHVRLYSAAGTCVFIGIAMVPEPVIEETRQEVRYRVESIAFLLQRINYKQNWRFPAEVPDEFIGPETEMTQALVSLVTLFRHYADGTKRSVYDVLDDALAQAVTKAGLQGWTITYDLSHVPNHTIPGTDQSNVQPPEDERKDPTIQDVVEACLRWVPYVQMRIDCSNGTPTIRFSAAPAIETSGLGAGLVIPGGRVHGAGFVTRVADVSQLTGAKATPLSDRFVNTISIHYLITYETENGEGQKIMWRNIEMDTASANNGALAELEITVPLRLPVWNGAAYTKPEQRPPNGIARALLQAYARVWWQYELEYTDYYPRWELRVGEGWRLNGLGAFGSDALSVAQEIVWDVGTGTTTIVTGAPAHLGYGDLAALFLANRLRNVPLRAGEQQYGMGEAEKKNSDTEEFTLREVDLPDSDTDNIYAIRAKFLRVEGGGP